MERNIVGVANLPEHGKFQVFLDCGHKMIGDHSVDRVTDYFEPTDVEPIICYQCLLPPIGWR